MTRAGRSAFRFRRGLLIAGLIFELCAVAWAFAPYVLWLFNVDWNAAGFLGTPLFVPESSETLYLCSSLLVVGLLLISQGIFLRPGRLLAIRLTDRGRPLRGSVIVAAAMAMFLTVGAFALIAEGFGWWGRLLERKDNWSTGTTLPAIWIGMAVIWAIWAWVFFNYWKNGDRYTQLGRMLRALIAGSLLEAIVAAPVQAYVTHKDKCYCERGSYTTLVFSGIVLFWAFGPAIVLLYLREHYRRARLFPHCRTCGYDLRGGQAICPECGTPFSVADFRSESDGNGET